MDEKSKSYFITYLVKHWNCAEYEYHNIIVNDFDPIIWVDTQLQNYFSPKPEITILFYKEIEKPLYVILDNKNGVNNESN